jgi:hypothetical protein
MLAFVLLLLLLIIIQASYADPTYSNPPSDSHSKSHHSHSHHSHSHHSHSHHSQSHSSSNSHSQGVCPRSGLVAATPNNASLYHLSNDWPCGYVFEELVDNTYCVQDYYPCIYPGGLTLAPTSVTLQLSEGGSNDNGYNWVSVALMYNFTHYNRLHPDKVLDCFNEPTPGPHNPPFLKWTQITSTRASCDRICLITNYYIIECSADYLTAKSGEYYIEIPYVGRFDFNVSVCFKERFQTDYASQCFAQMSTCPVDTAVDTSNSDASINGVRFSLLWTMALAMAALLLL